jgi:hypothetical protein
VLALGLWPLRPGTAGAVLVPVAVLGLALVGWFAMRQHDRRLCEPCMHSMPLNASELATRYHRQFAVAHASSNRSLGVGYLAVLVTANLVLLHLGLSGRICWAIIQSSMIYLVLAYSSHRRFQPWCPQCQEGDDDDVTAPTPAPQGGRSA